MFIRLTRIVCLMFALATLTHSPRAEAVDSRLIITPVDRVYRAQLAAFEVTRQTKQAPPLASWSWSFAHSAGAHSMRLASTHSMKSVAFEAAYLQALILVVGPHPVLTAAMQAHEMGLTAPQEKEVSRRARSDASQAWQIVRARFVRASRPLERPWPAQIPVGIWRPTPAAFAQPLLPYWGEMPMWKGDVRLVTKGFAPPRADSMQARQEIAVVQEVGGKLSARRTAAQTESALFWAAGAGTITPPGMWMQTAIAELQSRKAGLLDAVRVLTTLSQVLADAAIVCWSSKYEHRTWRPVSAIHTLSGQNSWEPLLSTPPFPSYTSGHSTFSMSAAAVLEKLLPQGSRAQVFIPSSEQAGQGKFFASYFEAAVDAGLSRIWGGIHVPADNRDGQALGQRVACLHIGCP